LTLNDPALVRAEYADERGLLGRRAAYEHADGPDPRELAFAAVEECRPTTVLEVGCGPGELAERIGRELNADVVAVDISPRMIELACARGVTARLGDVQRLPFADETFDCAVAAWMLYQVPDVDRALSELARVLRPGGRLVAVTNEIDHLLELRELVGQPGVRETAFNGTNGAELLYRRFADVERCDAAGTIRFPDRAAVLAYVRASPTLGCGATIPDAIPEPFVVTRHPVVFVADKA
jgi:SAM-dependent methyltransferase